MKIALFGGSFDPPHKGHLLVAQTMIDRRIVDQVWFIPSKNHPFAKKMAPADARLKMLQNIPNIMISSYELEKEGITYSADTLEYFAQEYPEHTFSWVMGADQLAKFSQWHRYPDILNKFQIYVYPRDGYASSPLFPGMELLSDVDTSVASSTKIRSSVAQHQDISDMTSQPVIAEIEKSKLYKDSYE